MGYETVVHVKRAGKRIESKVLLETEEIIVRGELRTKIPFKSIRKAAVERGALALDLADERILLELGADAAKKWLDKINNPKSRIDKLGVKKGQVVSIVGNAPEDFLNELEAQGVKASGKVAKDSDIIFLFADKPAVLSKISTLVKSMKRDGAIWVVHPRGRADLLDAHVFAAAKAAGLTDVKVARFSDTDTAEKLVIPLKDR